MSDLLAAVDALTKPVRTPVEQEVLETRLVDGKPVVDELGEVIRDRTGTTMVTVVHPPLLEQLEAAVSSTIGAGGGRSMTSAWTLAVLDSDALARFSQIESQIRDWCRLVGVRPGEHPGSNLRAWYAKRLSMNPTEVEDAGYRTILEKWAGSIVAKLNPPATIELTGPCIRCNSDVWRDQDGNGGPNPVIVTYYRDADILATASAHCRACDHRWHGSAELRALRWDMDHPEARETVEA